MASKADIDQDALAAEWGLALEAEDGEAADAAMAGGRGGGPATATTRWRPSGPP